MRASGHAGVLILAGADLSADDAQTSPDDQIHDIRTLTFIARGFD